MHGQPGATQAPSFGVEADDLTGARWPDNLSDEAFQRLLARLNLNVDALRDIVACGTRAHAIVSNAQAQLITTRGGIDRMHQNAPISHVAGGY
jgi:hypothetical protein